MSVEEDNFATDQQADYSERPGVKVTGTEKTEEGEIEEEEEEEEKGEIEEEEEEKGELLSDHFESAVEEVEEDEEEQNAVINIPPVMNSIIQDTVSHSSPSMSLTSSVAIQSPKLWGRMEEDEILTDDDAEKPQDHHSADELFAVAMDSPLLVMEDEGQAKPNQPIPEENSDHQNEDGHKEEGGEDMLADDGEYPDSGIPNLESEIDAPTLKPAREEANVAHINTDTFEPQTNQLIAAIAPAPKAKNNKKRLGRFGRPEDASSIVPDTSLLDEQGLTLFAFLGDPVGEELGTNHKRRSSRRMDSNLYYNCFRFAGMEFVVGDHVYFIEAREPNPFVSKIQKCFQTETGQACMQIVNYGRACDIRKATKNRKNDILDDEIFEINDVMVISCLSIAGKVKVLPFDSYISHIARTAASENNEPESVWAVDEEGYLKRAFLCRAKYDAKSQCISDLVTNPSNPVNNLTDDTSAQNHHETAMSEYVPAKASAPSKADKRSRKSTDVSKVDSAGVFKKGTPKTTAPFLDLALEDSKILAQEGLLFEDEEEIVIGFGICRPRQMSVSPVHVHARSSKGKRKASTNIADEEDYLSSPQLKRSKYKARKSMGKDDAAYAASSVKSRAVKPTIKSTSAIKKSTKSKVDDVVASRMYVEDAIPASPASQADLVDSMDSPVSAFAVPNYSISEEGPLTRSDKRRHLSITKNINFGQKINKMSKKKQNDTVAFAAEPDASGHGVESTYVVAKKGESSKSKAKYRNSSTVAEKGVSEETPATALDTEEAAEAELLVAAEEFYVHDAALGDSRVTDVDDDGMVDDFIPAPMQESEEPVLSADIAIESDKPVDLADGERAGDLDALPDTEKIEQVNVLRAENLVDAGPVLEEGEISAEDLHADESALTVYVQDASSSANLREKDNSYESSLASPRRDQTSASVDSDASPPHEPVLECYDSMEADEILDHVLEDIVEPDNAESSSESENGAIHSDDDEEMAEATSHSVAHSSSSSVKLPPYAFFASQKHKSIVKAVEDVTLPNSDHTDDVSSPEHSVVDDKSEFAMDSTPVAISSAAITNQDTALTVETASVSNIVSEAQMAPSPLDAVQPAASNAVATPATRIESNRNLTAEEEAHLFDCIRYVKWMNCHVDQLRDHRPEGLAKFRDRLAVLSDYIAESQLDLFTPDSLV